MKKAACRWCGCLCNMHDSFEHDNPKKDAICSKECLEKEQHFMLMYSDENIGLRNYEEFGVNPNDRGKNRGGRDNGKS